MLDQYSILWRVGIVLHAGLPKTGTSSIQGTLAKSREELLEGGVLYPFSAPNPNTPLGTIFRDDPTLQARNRGLTSQKIAERRREYLSALNAEVSRGGWDTLLLSGEVVSNLNTRELERIKDWAERYASGWKVLLGVRDPVEWSVSVIQQLLKGGRTLDPDLRQ